jgi:hypothetical protein
MNRKGLNIDRIVYEDDRTLLCDLIHDDRHYDMLDRYRMYFSESLLGYKYFTLIDKKDKNQHLVHAETERSDKVAIQALNFIKPSLYQKQNPSVLMLGMGTCSILKMIENFNPNISFTIYEYKSHLSSIVQYMVPKNTNIHYVDIYDRNKIIKIDKNRYDIIIDETQYDLKSNRFFYDNYLKDDGLLFFLCEHKIFRPNHWNYIMMKKRNSMPEFFDVCSVGRNIIGFHYEDWIKTIDNN